jgi:hypothetical protein
MRWEAMLRRSALATLIWLGANGRISAASPGGSILEGLGPVPCETTYGFGVPTIGHWSWRNTHYWPTQCTHTSYYGDHLDWSYRRGY